MGSSVALEPGYCNGGLDQKHACDVEESNDLDVLVLDGLDSYMDDIEERLTVSRMVSESLIKGMVNAVSQEAAETVAAKERELAELKEALSSHNCGCGVGGACGSFEGNIQRRGTNSWFADGFAEFDSFKDSLGILYHSAKEQLERLQCHVGTSQLANGSAIVPTCINTECAVENCLSIQSNFDSLNATIQAMSRKVNALAPVENWKIDVEISREVESMVYMTLLENLQEEHERRLLDISSVLSLIDKFKEIPRVCRDLEFIQKFLVAPETSDLSPGGSLESDNLHRKVFVSQGSSPGSLWDRNGNDEEESKFSLPETLQTSKLSHMNVEELYKHFRTEMLKMKRDHESTIAQMTDEYFKLKRVKGRESLKDRGPFVPYIKDKDLEMLKKKITEVVSKLDVIVKDNEKLSEFCNHSRETLENLMSENHRLRNSLNEQNLEICNLYSEASELKKDLAEHKLVKENLQKMVRDLKITSENDNIEASLNEDVRNCILREVTAQFKSDHDDLVLKSIIMHDIIGSIYEEAAHEAEDAMKLNYYEQQTSAIFFQEALRDAAMELDETKRKCVEYAERLRLLEPIVPALEGKLAMLVEENKDLKGHVSQLVNSIKEKNECLLAVNTEHEKERQEFSVAKDELRNLTEHLNGLVAEKNEEIVNLKGKLENVEKELDDCRVQVDQLNEKLQLSEHNLRIAFEEKTSLSAEKEQKELALFRERDVEQRKEIESILHTVLMLSKSLAEFDRQTVESIRWQNVRLENSTFQLLTLAPKVNLLRRKGRLNKERLEKRDSDLRKAEAEVDVLGDEVDALLNLLEKIYVALDHYSPVLQHYPGIMEILKLVKRELSGEAIKTL